jgi:hypothetical protein
MSNKLFSIIREVNDLLDLRLKNLYTFQMMYDEWTEDQVHFIGNVKSTSVIRKSYHLRFIVEMPPSAHLPLHWHDCLEKVTVLSGQIIDEEKPGRIYNVDEVYEVKPMIKHMIKNNLTHKTTTLQVDFFK